MKDFDFEMELEMLDALFSSDIPSEYVDEMLEKGLMVETSKNDKDAVYCREKNKYFKEIIN